MVRNKPLLIAAVVGAAVVALVVAGVGVMLLGDYMQDRRDRQELPELRSELKHVRNLILDEAELMVKEGREPSGKMMDLYARYEDAWVRHEGIIARHPEWQEPHFPPRPRP